MRAWDNDSISRRWSVSPEVRVQLQLSHKVLVPLLQDGCRHKALAGLRRHLRLADGERSGIVVAALDHLARERDHAIGCRRLAAGGGCLLLYLRERRYNNAHLYDGRLWWRQGGYGQLHAKRICDTLSWFDRRDLWSERVDRIEKTKQKYINKNKKQWKVNN